MKITIDLPSDLVLAGKAKATEENRPYNDVMIESLRKGLEIPKANDAKSQQISDQEFPFIP